MNYGEVSSGYVIWALASQPWATMKRLYTLHYPNSAGRYGCFTMDAIRRRQVGSMPL